MPWIVPQKYFHLGLIVGAESGLAALASHALALTGWHPPICLQIPDSPAAFLESCRAIEAPALSEIIRKCCSRACSQKAPLLP